MPLPKRVFSNETGEFDSALSQRVPRNLRTRYYAAVNRKKEAAKAIARLRKQQQLTAAAAGGPPKQVAWSRAQQGPVDERRAQMFTAGGCGTQPQLLLALLCAVLGSHCWLAAA